MKNLRSTTRFFHRQTTTLTLIFLLIFLAGVEGILRIRAVQKQLPPPDLFPGYEVLNAKVQDITYFSDRHKQVDCIFLGSSVVMSGIVVDQFAHAYSQQTNTPITCYNFGIYGISASSIASITDLLIDRYHPNLLIYGTTLRDFQDSKQPIEEAISANAWLRYQQGAISLEALLLNKSALYRYYKTLPVLLDSEADFNEFNREQAVVMDVYGNLPLVFFATDAPRLASQAAYQIDFRLSVADVAGLTHIAKLAGVQTIIVEMPAHPSHHVAIMGNSEDYHAAFSDLLALATAGSTAYVWAAPELDFLNLYDWADPLHLFASGAYKYSQWLGAQVGAAAQADFPADYARQLPLPDLSIPEPDYVPSRLSAATRHNYDSHRFSVEGLPDTAVLFNPAAYDTAYRLNARDALGYFLDIDPLAPGLTGEERASIFDLIWIVEHMRFESELTLDPAQVEFIAAWRTSKNPADLRAAGIEYLVYSDKWAGWLGSDERASLQDPTTYEPLGSWSHEIIQENFLLFRVLG